MNTKSKARKSTGRKSRSTKSSTPSHRNTKRSPRASGSMGTGQSRWDQRDTEVA